MKAHFPAVVVMVALVGCATSFAQQATGVIGDDPATGHIMVAFNGSGSFSIATKNGLSCEGVYDAIDFAPATRALAICNDGRSGPILLAKSRVTAGGRAIGKLGDGTVVGFVFGNVASESEPVGSATQLHALPRFEDQ